MTDLLPLVLLVAVAVALGVVGIRVGMLVAPRVERWGTPPEPDEKDTDSR